MQIATRVCLPSSGSNTTRREPSCVFWTRGEKTRNGHPRGVNFAENHDAHTERFLRGEGEIGCFLPYPKNITPAGKKQPNSNPIRGAKNERYDVLSDFQLINERLEKQIEENPVLSAPEPHIHMCSLSHTYI